MLTSKQRSNLRSLAAAMPAITQIGKNGISDSLIASLDESLENREMIKVSILDNSSAETFDMGEELAKALKAEFVCAIGKKVILYRTSRKDKIKHLQF